MAQERIGAAVVGVGIWGQNHALVYHDYHRSRLLCVCDQNEQRAREVAERFSCDYVTDYDEIVRNSEIKIVSIATPDHAHFAPALAMIEAGKHVLIEKPLATSVEEAQALVRASQRSPGKAMVNFQMRWHPAHLAIKEAILDGQLGQLYMGYARLSDVISVPTQWFKWSANSGPHWFLFPHTMDIMRWFLDEEPTEVYAVGRKGVLSERGIDTYDAIQALVRFGEAFVTFETSWIVPDSNPSVVDSYYALYGTKGKVELNASYNGLAFAGEHKFSYPWAPVGRRNLYGRLDHRIYEPIKYFVDCVVDDVQPVVTLVDGLINTAMIAATVESLETGRPVRLDIARLLKG